mmetsp:Transcript_28709/g.40586  ORF Transcript_28709/g.40586 Transcript_28709/m.40586 type:complete len:170 (+) Transcript_28709:172-681(+)
MKAPDPKRESDKARKSIDNGCHKYFPSQQILCISFSLHTHTFPRFQQDQIQTMSFGKWYDEQKTQENGENGNTSSWFGNMSLEEGLPLFAVPPGVEMPTFQGMKASLEAQLPQNVMGMNYQQRFQVRLSESGHICSIEYLPDITRDRSSVLFFSCQRFSSVLALVLAYP